MASVVEWNKENDETAQTAACDQLLFDGSTLLEMSSLQPRQDSGPVPLSFAQERLWFLDQIDPGNPSANISRAQKITGELNQELLQQSLSAIVNRHEALRTTFATSQLYAGVDSKPAQLVAASGRVVLTVAGPFFVSSGEPILVAEEFARSEAQRPFDLMVGPLLRARLLVLEPDKHVLVLTVHRLVCDEHSLGLLVAEIWQTYGAALNGEMAELPAPRIQLADYSAWQRDQLTEEYLEPHSDYWQSRLHGAPALLELPADHPRLPVQSWHGASVSLNLDRSLSEGLMALARSENTNLFVILMSAFQILLARYSGQMDIVTGSEFGNREAIETRSLIGPLANDFALRTDLSDDPTFRDLVARVQKNVEEAQAHGLMPFEKLVAEMQLEPSMSYAPVFQMALNVREKSDYGTAPAGLVLEEFALETGVSRRDLTLEVQLLPTHTGETPVPRAEEIRLRFEYDSDLFDRETIAGLAGHFEVLLRGIVRNRDGRISALPLLGQGELHRIVHEWNSSDTVPQSAQCVHELFEATAEKIPQSTALVCGEVRLTYAQLNGRANQLAHHLRQSGIGPEIRVGVYLERSIDNIVALLAILKAGGAYVPIDPTYPQDRVSFMLEDSGVPVLISQKSLAISLPAQQARVVQIDEDWPRLSSEGEGNPKPITTPENLAYVIYTSGSTGRPKGVTVTHKAVTHLLAATREKLGFREGDVWTTVHSSAFDFSVWEIWGALLQGGQLVIVPLEVTQSPAALSELLLKEGVTILNQTPSALRQLLDSQANIQELGLRTIICGGDALDRDLAETLGTIEIPVWNFYGPTESTVWATCTRIEAAQTSVSDFSRVIQSPQQSQAEVCATNAAQAERCPTSIGRPISGLEVFVLDKNLQPVPVRVPGEICLGGAGLARGYLHRPELTAERFVPSPYPRSPGERLYRTGDLGRYLPGGKVEFLGRLDNQVKLRGFRIELGEIETLLGQYPEVEQAVVTIREDQPGDKRLVAYVVPGPANFSLSPAGREIESQIFEINEIDTNETNRQTEVWRTELIAGLRRLLAEKLPEYMMPSAFVLLDALPLTPNRKIDRRSLPKPDAGRRDLDNTYLAPRDNLEKQLVNIWERILSIETVGVKDSFFELGGHSLLAVRLFAQIENRFGKRLPLAALFQAPTVEQLANVLREDVAGKAWSSLVAIQPQGSSRPLYCIHAAGANVLIYRPLSRHLGNDQPVYALQARGLDGQQEPFLHVEEMAAHYIREMRAFQPEGPYHLLGASFGGLVIFEMAQQLVAQGQQVGLLAMLNTNCPVFPTSKRVGFHLGHLREHGPRFYAWAIWQTLKRKMGRPTVSVAVDANPDPQLARLIADRRNGDEALIRTVSAIMDAEKDYSPRRKIYPGKITLFWAEDAESDEEDNRLGWEKLAQGGLEVHRIPGTHVSIREEPHVAILAEKLRRCLEI